MSTLKEYEELDKIRKEEGEKSNAHYKSVNLPGDRTFDHSIEDARAMVEAMKKEKAKPNHDKAD